MLKDVVNTIAHHLAVQGKPAISPVTGLCCYRLDGMSCAVGCLIPDELYHSGMENKHVSDLMFEYPDVRAHILELMPDVSPNTAIKLLITLQDYHDKAFDSVSARLHNHTVEQREEVIKEDLLLFADKFFARPLIAV